MLTAAIVALLAFRGTQTPQDDLPRVPLAPKGVTLSLKEAPPTDRKAPKGTMEFKLRLENRSEGAVVIFRTGFGANHVALLKDDDGKELPLTRQGLEDRRWLRTSYGNRDSNRSIVLQPGESYDYGARLDFAKMYEISPGARYTLSIVYLEQEGFPMWVASNPLPIRTLSLEEAVP